MPTAHHCEPLTSILAVTPHLHDQVALRNILSHSNWRLDCVGSLDEASRFLRDRAVSVVITEKVFPDGQSWRTLLEEIERMPGGPALIVASRGADQRLWTEILDAGAFELLSKPFQVGDVVRAVGLASRQFRDRRALCRRLTPPSTSVLTASR